MRNVDIQRAIADRMKERESRTEITQDGAGRYCLNDLYGEGGCSVLSHTLTNPQNGQTYPVFNLPKDLTLTLVAGYNVKLRKRIIDRWMELEAKATQPAIPQTLPEALRLAAEAIEKSEKLALENKAQADMQICIPTLVPEFRTASNGQSPQGPGQYDHYHGHKQWMAQPFPALSQAGQKLLAPGLQGPFVPVDCDRVKVVQPVGKAFEHREPPLENPILPLAMSGIRSCFSDFMDATWMCWC